MRILIVLGLFPLLISAKTVDAVKKGDLHPAYDEAPIPGSKIPLEELNTAPTPPPTDAEEADFRNTLKAREEEEEELESKELLRRKK